MQEAAITGADLCLFHSPVPIDHSDLVADLLKELSNHNERVEERKGALLELLKITREDSLGVWEEHFKTILLLLLETLGDKDVRPWALAGEGRVAASRSSGRSAPRAGQGSLEPCWPGTGSLRMHFCPCLGFISWALKK